MKTVSINETLYSVFGEKKYTAADFKRIKHLTLSQFSFAKVVQDVDFSELKFFPNLENVLLKDITLSDEKLAYLLTPNMKTLSFVRCDWGLVSEDILAKCNLDNLYISGCFGFTTQFNYPALKDLEIHSATLDGSFSPRAKNLDITACLISDYSFLKSPVLEKLTISASQYGEHKALYESAPFKVDVMDRNGEFVSLSVGGGR